MIIALLNSLFGELMQRWPFHGPKERWHDEVVGDLCAIVVGDGWFQLCQDCKQWLEVCSSAVDVLAQNKGTMFFFQFRGDLPRHCNFCGASNLLLVQEESYNSAITVHCKCVCVHACVVCVCVRLV